MGMNEVQRLNSSNSPSMMKSPRAVWAHQDTVGRLLIHVRPPSVSLAVVLNSRSTVPVRGEIVSPEARHGRRQEEP